MEDTLDRGRARLSRGARGAGLGGLRATAWDLPNGPPTRRARRRRQGCQRRTGSIRSRGKTTPSDAIDRAPKWEARREARLPPVSFASEGPEPEGACPARLRTGGAAREEDVRVVEHGAARLREESDPSRSLRWESTKYECSSGTVSECRSRSDAPPVATRRGNARWEAHRGHARPSANESREPGQGPREDLVRRRCADLLGVFPKRETRAGPRRTRKPRRDRIRRGAGSGTREVQGPRAGDCRYDGRVSESRDASP